MSKRAGAGCGKTLLEPRSKALRHRRKPGAPFRRTESRVFQTWLVGWLDLGNTRCDVIGRQTLCHKRKIVWIVKEHVAIGSQLVWVSKRIQRNSSHQSCGIHFTEAGRESPGALLERLH